MKNGMGVLGLALVGTAWVGAALVGCGEAGVIDSSSGFGDGVNPFLDNTPANGKMDSQYFNPDGIEVEMDVEADIEAPAWRMDVAPATLTQYAMTLLRREGSVYLESLAEDASSPDRVEWLVDGEWISAKDAKSLELGDSRHFRIRGMNAVLLHKYTDLAQVGQVIEAAVPIRPYKVMEEAGKACAEADAHLGLSASIYWYLWEPDRSGCEMVTQNMTLTVSKVLPKDPTYPEYDRLIEDGRVTAVVLFGQIGDDMGPSEPGFRNLRRMAWNLERADYVEVEAPLGRRFSKTVHGIELVIDLYSPKEFAGLSDHAHFDNFQRAISDYEIVAYDGHSMLGASDFWARPEYPDFYQVFLYGGCLGYEYYVRPIVDGKGGWQNVDIVSSVVEVSADANYFAGPFFAKLEKAIDQEYRVDWKEILGAIRTSVGDSTFGASGVRENCFTPDGTRCVAPESTDPNAEPADPNAEPTDPNAEPDPS